MGVNDAGVLKALDVPTSHHVSIHIQPLSDLHYKKAKAIKIANRYFCGFGKNNRVNTSWSLAGAKLFIYDDDISQALEEITAKKSMRQRVWLVKVIEYDWGWEISDDIPF